MDGTRYLWDDLGWHRICERYKSFVILVPDPDMLQGTVQYPFGSPKLFIPYSLRLSPIYLEVKIYMLST